MEMTVDEFVEAVLGVKLLDCQKIFLKELYEKYKENDGRLVTIYGRGSNRFDMTPIYAMLFEYYMKEERQ